MDPNAVLVCAGDSLTAGLNPNSDGDTYVERLRERFGCKVINAGVADDRTADLLARAEKDVLSHNPTAVLIFIGGNDYLNGTPRREFARDLNALVSRVAETSATLVIVEVPSGIIWNTYAGICRRLARRYEILVVPESRLRWWYVRELLIRTYLSDPLTIDGIHLSPSGVTKVADWLEPYLRYAMSHTRPGGPW
jgi:acyl-CoA thioesterase-1